MAVIYRQMRQTLKSDVARRQPLLSLGKYVSSNDLFSKLSPPHSKCGLYPASSLVPRLPSFFGGYVKESTFFRIVAEKADMGSLGTRLPPLLATLLLSMTTVNPLPTVRNS